MYCDLDGFGFVFYDFGDLCDVEFDDDV